MKSSPSQTIKVLHVLAELRYSGAETLINALAPTFARQGIQTTVLATGRTEGPYAEVLREAGCKVLHIPIRPFPLFAISYLKLLLRKRYTVIHLHQEKAFFWTALISRLFTKVLVRTFHSCYPFTGFLRHKRIAMRWLVRRILRAQMIAASASITAHEKKHLHSPTVTALNGINTEYFSPTYSAQKEQGRSVLGVPTTGIVFAVVGSCLPVKKHETLYQALAQLKQIDPNSPDFTLLHLGDGPLQKEEKKICHRLNLSNNIHFLGTRKDVRPILAASDIFVMCSEYEGLPIACMEAMAMGLPVIGTEVSGLRELIDHEHNGLLVPFGDAKALAEALRDLARNPERSKRMGKRGRKKIVANYGIEQLVSQLAGIYTEERTV